MYAIYEKDTGKLLALQESKPKLPEDKFFVVLTNNEVRNLTLHKNL